MPFDYTTSRQQECEDLFLRLSGTLADDEILAVIAVLVKHSPLRFLFLDTRKLVAAEPETLLHLEDFLADLTRQGVRVVISDGKIRVGMKVQAKSAHGFD